MNESVKIVVCLNVLSTHFTRESEGLRNSCHGSGMTYGVQTRYLLNTRQITVASLTSDCRGMLNPSPRVQIVLFVISIHAVLDVQDISPVETRWPETA